MVPIILSLVAKKKYNLFKGLISYIFFYVDYEFLEVNML